MATLHRGSFGAVYQVTDQSKSNFYTMKIMYKLSEYPTYQNEVSALRKIYNMQLQSQNQLKIAELAFNNNLNINFDSTENVNFCIFFFHENCFFTLIFCNVSNNKSKTISCGMIV